MLPFADAFFETFFYFWIGAAKLVVVVAIFLLTFYVISQVFEIKMDANLGHIFGKWWFCFLQTTINISLSHDQEYHIHFALSLTWALALENSVAFLMCVPVFLNIYYTYIIYNVCIKLCFCMKYLTYCLDQFDCFACQVCIVLPAFSV